MTGTPADGSGEWIKLGSIGAIPVGKAASYPLEGDHTVAVFRTAESQFYALDDLCTHANARLSEGFMEDGCVACPWHGALFDLETGEALTPPAFVDVKTYPVELRNGELWICRQPNCVRS